MKGYHVQFDILEDKGPKGNKVSLLLLWPFNGVYQTIDCS